MEDFSVSGQSNQCPCNDGIIRTRDSVIEEIRTDRNTGFVTISYGVMGDFNMTHMMLVTLIVSRDTIIQDRAGRNMLLSDLREGMIVDAEFSSAMTFSIPPQSRAYRIRAVNRNATSILDRNGKRIPLRDIRKGQRVRVEHATFQTPSIPPQTTAFVVQII